jgi:hypothetical protein
VLDSERRRAVTVGLLPTEPADRIAVLGDRIAGAAGDEADGVIVAAEAIRLVFGRVPSLGSGVRMDLGNGTEEVVKVVGVVERAPAGISVWMPQPLFGVVVGTNPVRDVALLRSADSLESIRRTVSQALVRPDVSLIEAFSRRAELTDIERYAHRLIDLTILIHLLTIAVLVRRWAIERRSALMATRTAALGPAFLARSVNQDVIAHVGAAACAGSAAGWFLAWTLAGQVVDIRQTALHLAVIVVTPVLVAALVARVPAPVRTGKARSAGRAA